MNPSDLANEYCHFFDEGAFVETERAGFRRRIITGDRMQLCFWRIDGGATGSYLHKHDEHEQLGIVVRGRLDFRIGDDEGDEQRIVLGAGDVYMAPLGVWHGDSVFVGDDELGECWILDVFVPPRDDLRADERRAAASAGANGSGAPASGESA